MKHAALTALLVAIACSGVACSSFQRDWTRTVQAGASGPPAGGVGRAVTAPAGPWVGTWRSENSRHSGPLRCLVTEPTDRRLPGRPWQFRYHARYLGILSGEFWTAQPVEEPRSGVFVSRGDWALPKWAGGTYRYDITITRDEFRGTYRSRDDHGTFSMKRPTVRGVQ